MYAGHIPQTVIIVIVSNIHVSVVDIDTINLINPP